MGGGRNKFELRGINSTGERSDEDLVLNWKQDKRNRFANMTAEYVTNREELMQTDLAKVDFVLGKNNYFLFI